MPRIPILATALRFPFPGMNIVAINKIIVSILRTLRNGQER